MLFYERRKKQDRISLRFTYYLHKFTRKDITMDKKLTLSLDKAIIEKAKSYAKQNKTSLSKMIEVYFDSLTSDADDNDHIRATPLVESLCGVIKLPKDFDYKKSKAEYLLEKYK